MLLKVASKQSGTFWLAADGRFRSVRDPSNFAGSSDTANSRHALQRQEPSMNPHSGVHREIFQRLLANAFAVQERRDSADPLSAQLEPKENLASESPLPDALGEITDPEITDPEENFVPPPEFLMLPQNQHSLDARCAAVMAGVMELLGLRHLALLATRRALRASTVAPQDREQDFVPASVAPALSQEAKILNPGRRWRNSAPPAVAAGLARRARNFDWPNSLGNFTPREVAAGLMRRARNLNWSIGWRNSATTTFVSGLAHRARNLHQPGRWRNFALTSLASGFAQQAKTFGWPNRPRNFAPRALASALQQRTKNFKWPHRWRNSTSAAIASAFAQRTKIMRLPNWRRNFTPATVVSGFAQQAQNLNWSNLRRCCASVAVAAAVLTFTFLMAYKPSHPANMVAPSVLPSANAMEQPSSIPQLIPGKPAPASETASTSPKPVAPATKALRRVRVGPNEVQYIGDDVTVRTFNHKWSTQRSREPNSRAAHIGDDVTVHYFASPPPARTTTR